MLEPLPPLILHTKDTTLIDQIIEFSKEEHVEIGLDINNGNLVPYLRGVQIRKEEIPHMKGASCLCLKVYCKDHNPIHHLHIMPTRNP